jgi:hypothetical protein
MHCYEAHRIRFIQELSRLGGGSTAIRTFSEKALYLYMAVENSEIGHLFFEKFSIFPEIRAFSPSYHELLAPGKIQGKFSIFVSKFHRRIPLPP